MDALADTLKKRRHVVRTQPRAVTITARALHRERDPDAEDSYPEGVERPRTRGECEPCEDCQLFVQSVVKGALKPGAKPWCGHEAAHALFRCRPCPFVSCGTHLYADVTRTTGSIKINFPHLGADELPETCTQDVADRGPVTLEQIGDLMNLTRERVRQVEMIAFRELRKAIRDAGLTRNTKEWLAEIAAQPSAEEEYPPAIAHGDGPTLLELLDRWERNAGAGMAGRAFSVMRDDECTVPEIAKRMPGAIPRVWVKTALDLLLAQGRVTCRVKQGPTGTVTLYRRAE